MGERESKRLGTLGREDARKQKCSPPKTGTYKKNRPVDIRKAQSENAILTFKDFRCEKKKSDYAPPYLTYGFHKR